MNGVAVAAGVWHRLGPSIQSQPRGCPTRIVFRYACQAVAICHEGASLKRCKVGGTGDCNDILKPLALQCDARLALHIFQLPNVLGIYECRERHLVISYRPAS